MTIDSADPLGNCTPDELLALVWDEAGQEGVRLFLRKAGCDRETLSEAAGKLEAAGLVEAAGIVRAAALQAATRASVGIAAIMPDDDRIRQKAYLAAAYRRGTVTASDMAKADIPSEVIVFATRSRR